MNKFLFYLIAAIGCIMSIQAKITHHQYCIVGSGPGGLQMAFFMKRANRDYIVFERNNVSGSFFRQYPRHRRLLSVNKINTGAINSEFNLRHDWNSLLSDNDSLTMPHYSDQYYPHADDMVRYLNDYASGLQLNIQYNTAINKISRVHYKQSLRFKLTTKSQSTYICDVAIVSTGMAKPNIPTDIQGIHHAVGYESISTNSSEYKGQNILILGQGNSAFETAESLASVSNLLHLYGRDGIRLATSTHYIGDIRAINTKVIDSYQLKTLDGLLEGDLQNVGFFKNKDKRYTLGTRADENGPFTYDVTGGSKEYHTIIRCLGFRYDTSIFSKTAFPEPGRRFINHYPDLDANYESASVPNMYFAGALSHSLDYRRSGGCCIQGFRYTARALHRLLEWRYHQNPWPVININVIQIVDQLITRMNQASGLYQMFSTLADVILIGNDQKHQYLEEVPVAVIPRLHALTGKKITHGFITLTFEYGKGFSRPGKDTLAQDNYSHNVTTAYKSQNIHPVVRYYRQSIRATTRKGKLPRPDKIHHVIEDFLTDWSIYSKHGHYLKLFIQSLFKRDISQYFIHSCHELSMIIKTLPDSCWRQSIQKVDSFNP